MSSMPTAQGAPKVDIVCGSAMGQSMKLTKGINSSTFSISFFIKIRTSNFTFSIHPMYTLSSTTTSTK